MKGGKTMTDTLKIMKECGAFLEGHFLLTSGRHSGQYCQCAKLLRFPDKAAEVLELVEEQVKHLPITKVCGPAMGGVVVSYEIARRLGVESIFTERKDGVMQLSRGFTVDENDVVLISEDVVTTGRSTMETLRVLESFGAKVVGVGCIVDRRSPDCQLDMPIYSAAKIDLTSYTPEECPYCKEGSLPLVKPGSRDMKIV
jgi:orotate phosphoribosyltransferase